MTIGHLLLCAATLAISATACRHAADTPIPRRTAYPRIELYDTCYRTLPSTGIEVNAQATASVGKGADGDATWIDIAYPRYRATMRLTLRRLSGRELDRAIANRMERADRDAGGSAAEITEIASPDGIETIIALTPQARVTPLQIIATDHRSFLLSGAVQLDASEGWSGEAARPAVEAVRRDMEHLATHLHIR